MSNRDISLASLYEKPTFNREKLKQILFFIYDYCYENKKSLGKTRLQKILWFCEANHYKNTNNYLFGGTFRKMQYGPYMKEVNMLNSELEEEFIENNNNIYKILKPYSDDLINDIEKSNITSIINIISTRLANEVSDVTHNLHWEITEVGDTLPIQTAFEDMPNNDIDDDIIAWALEEIEEYKNNNAS